MARELVFTINNPNDPKSRQHLNDPAYMKRQSAVTGAPMRYGAYRTLTKTPERQIGTVVVGLLVLGGIGVGIAALAGAFNGSTTTTTAASAASSLGSAAAGSSMGRCAVATEPAIPVTATFHYPPPNVEAWWDLYTYAPDYDTYNFASAGKHYLPGSEMCGGIRYLQNQFAGRYPDYALPNPTAINTRIGNGEAVTFASELKAFEAAMVAGSMTLPKNLTREILVFKVWSMALKFSEAASNFKKTMKTSTGHAYGTRYLSRVLYDPDFKIQYIDKPAGMSLWEHMWTEIKGYDNAPYGGWWDSTAAIWTGNIAEHYQGAFTAMPNTGYVMYPKNPLLIGMTMANERMDATLRSITPFPMDAGNPSLPKLFPTCSSARNLHFYLDSIPVGDTSFLCTNRGGVIINSLIDMLELEEAIAADAASSGAAVADCAGRYITKTAMADIFMEFENTMKWTRKNWDGIRLFTETDYARIVELYMVSVAFHVKIMNNHCGHPDYYNASYPEIPFAEGNPLAVKGFTKQNITTSATHTVPAGLTLMEETQKYGLCYGQWGRESATGICRRPPYNLFANGTQNYNSGTGCLTATEKAFCTAKGITQETTMPATFAPVGANVDWSKWSK